MFLKYFTKLTESLRDQAHHLYNRITFLELTDIFKDMNHCDIELLLAVIAIQLYQDNVQPFYEMLKFMKYRIKDLQHLAAEVQQEVSTFNQDLSYGTYIWYKSSTT